MRYCLPISNPQNIEQPISTSNRVEQTIVSCRLISLWPYSDDITLLNILICIKYSWWDGRDKISHYLCELFCLGCCFQLQPHQFVLQVTEQDRNNIYHTITTPGKELFIIVKKKTQTSATLRARSVFWIMRFCSSLSFWI